MSYLLGLTNRLPRAHVELNAVRETPHHSQRPRLGPPNSMTLTPTTPGRFAARALVLVAAFAALLVVAAPAVAAKSCARAVIDDWYDDGRVDGTYPLHCYDDAIENLPRDVADYSSAKEDIQRALQARMRNEEAPPATTDPSPESPSSPDDPTTSPPDEPVDEPTETSSAPPVNGPDDGDGENEVIAPVDTESASSVPIPLLILAGLALLLVAGGSAGYLIRRYQARRPPARAS